MRARATAPAKVILLGEHFVADGGTALACAIDARVSAEARPRAGGTVRIESRMGAAEAGTAPGDGDGAVPPALRPLLFAARESGAGGLELTVESPLTPGMGLGSSSACCVAAAGALLRLARGSEPPIKDALDLASRAERTAFPGASGVDAAACAHGGAMLYSAATGRRPVGAPGDGDPCSPRLVVAESSRAHSTAEAVARAGRFRDANPSEYSEMRSSAGKLASAGAHALASGDLAWLGWCMSENQALLARLGASNAELDALAEAGGGLSHGAKITGAGGGGCAVALADRGRAPRTARAFLKAGARRCFTARIDREGLEFP